MDVHTEKGDKASNSHSYEDVKGQLTGLSNHHPPPDAHARHKSRPVCTLAHFTVIVTAAS